LDQVPAEVGRVHSRRDWGNPPWRIDFRPKRRRLPEKVDFAIVGAGFSGLATAAWLRRVAPKKSVAVFEAGRIGAGSSGHTGGIALPETAAGDLPGLGDVLRGFRRILRALRVNCDFEAGGVYELTHHSGAKHSPIRWADSGELRVAKSVPGGTVDPGKLVGGLALSAERWGAMIFEDARVEKIAHQRPLRLLVHGREVLAGRALVATNAMSLELSGLEGLGVPSGGRGIPKSRQRPNAGADMRGPKFTLAVATRPLKASQLNALGLSARRPFYTIDLPYLGAGCCLRTVSFLEAGSCVWRTGAGSRQYSSLKEKRRDCWHGCAIAFAGSIRR